MKKTFISVIAAVLAASALFMVGCSNGNTSDVIQGAMSSDDYITLGSTSVTAISYPGKIVYDWSAVKNADNYTVQVLNDGVVASTYTAKTSSTTGTLTPTADGMEYTIRVAARGNAVRALKTLDGDFAETTVKAIVPPAGTKANELTAYEKSSKKDEKAAPALAADGITVTQKDDGVYVTFNGKTYLNYKVALDKDYDETKITSVATTGTDVSVEKNDTPANAKLTVPAAGTYTVNVQVAAGANYIPEVVSAATKVTYEAFVTNAIDGTASAKYQESTNGNKAVRLTWTPVSYEGKLVPTTYYKVYVSSKKDATLKAVEATVKSSDYSDRVGNDSEIKYFIDTEVADTSLSYTYTIVLTDGNGKYATNYGTATLGVKNVKYSVAGTVDAYAAAKDTDTKKNDLVVTITKADPKQTLKAVYIKGYDKDYQGIDVALDLTSTTNVVEKFALDSTITDNKTVYTYTFKDLADGSYAVMAEFKDAEAEPVRVTFTPSLASTIKVTE